MKPQFLFLNSSNPVALTTPGMLEVVVAFDDLAAGHRATHSLCHLTQQLDNELVLEPLYWRFDLLGNLFRSGVETAQTDRADLLIISVSNPAGVPDAVNHWIERCVARRGEAGLTIIAHFGPEEPWTIWARGDLRAGRSDRKSQAPLLFAPLPHQEELLAI